MNLRVVRSVTFGAEPEVADQEPPDAVPLDQDEAPLDQDAALLNQEDVPFDQVLFNDSYFLNSHLIVLFFVFPSVCEVGTVNIPLTDFCKHVDRRNLAFV